MQIEPKIFVVEDDPSFGNKLASEINNQLPEFNVIRFERGQDCIDNLHQNPDLITLDYLRADKMPSEDILKNIKNYNPDIPVIIISGQQKMEVAIQLIKEGAYDYIIKDAKSIPRLITIIERFKEKQRLRKKVRTLTKEVSLKYKYSKILVGTSKPMEEIFNLMDKAASTNITVTITGETGTGKDLVAKAIHYNSDFKDGDFVVVNMAAIPGELIESELFGHEKGAFTGAITRRIGKFEQASGGTIFLDEIAETPLHLQSKLLRVLQEKEITRIGSNAIIPVDSRIIVATNKDMPQEVKKGNFREDLYYRLIGFPIEIPPLRSRGDDILILSKYFLNMFCKQNRMEKMALSNDAQNTLLNYHWAGNVRELKAIIERAAVMTNEETIRQENLNFSSSLSDGSTTFYDDEMTMEDYKYKILNSYLEKANNNIESVSEKLEISKATIYRMLKNLN